MIILIYLISAHFYCPITTEVYTAITYQKSTIRMKTFSTSFSKNNNNSNKQLNIFSSIKPALLFECYKTNIENDITIRKTCTTNCYTLIRVL